MSVSNGLVADVQQRRKTNVKKTSLRDIYLHTDAFLASTKRPLRSYMDFILFILWKYSRKAFDLCEFSNEHLEAFISYYQTKKTRNAAEPLICNHHRCSKLFLSINWSVICIQKRHLLRFEKRPVFAST